MCDYVFTGGVLGRTKYLGFELVALRKVHRVSCVAASRLDL
jgi:hypothetical protein